MSPESKNETVSGEKEGSRVWLKGIVTDTGKAGTFYFIRQYKRIRPPIAVSSMA